MTDNYQCFVISNKPHLFPPIQKSLSPVEVQLFNGTDYPSFSKLVNSCVAAATSETVVLMSDKVLPTSNDLSKMLDLLDNGYAFVALYRLAFFGFKKELFRRIGFFDERFVGGGYEDDDFYIRLKEANLASYITEEVNYTRSNSSWNYSESKIFFREKWGEGTKFDGIATRYLEEETYNYDLGNATNEIYLPWTESYIRPVRVRKYQNIIINKEIR